MTRVTHFDQLRIGAEVTTDAGKVGNIIHVELGHSLEDTIVNLQLKDPNTKWTVKVSSIADIRDGRINHICT